MTTGTPTLEKPRLPTVPPGSGGDGGGGGRPEGPGEFAAARPASPARIAVWLLVAAITILFASFTSTYLVRRGESDWRVGPLPSILWVNTAVLLLSSATMEWARSRGRRGQLDGLRIGLTVTTALGVAFLLGQIQAWRELVAAGIYMATNPHGAFFYLLTGTHGLHLVGGVLGLFYVLMKVRRTADAPSALDTVDAAATYWHFLDGLWLYLFIVLFGI